MGRAEGGTAEVASGGSGRHAGTPGGWEIRMLYDGACPLCMKEVDFLKRRDAQRGGRIDFVDIASPSYSPDENAGISYEQAMRKIHAITATGEVVAGVEVFRRLYEAVGLGYLYAITRVEPIGRLAEAVYNVWAKYRMEVTGREPLELILSKRLSRQQGSDGGVAMCGTDKEPACELPPAKPPQ